MILSAKTATETFAIETDSEEFEPEELLDMFEELMEDIGASRGWHVKITLGNNEDSD